MASNTDLNDLTCATASKASRRLGSATLYKLSICSCCNWDNAERRCWKLMLQSDKSSRVSNAKSDRIRHKFSPGSHSSPRRAMYRSFGQRKWSTLFVVSLRNFIFHGYFFDGHLRENMFSHLFNSNIRRLWLCELINSRESSVTSCDDIRKSVGWCTSRFRSSASVRSEIDFTCTCWKLIDVGLANSERCLRLTGCRRDNNASHTFGGRKTSDFNNSCPSADSQHRVLSRFNAQYSIQISYSFSGQFAGHMDSCIFASFYFIQKLLKQCSHVQWHLKLVCCMTTVKLLKQKYSISQYVIMHTITHIHYCKKSFIWLIRQHLLYN